MLSADSRRALLRGDSTSPCVQLDAMTSYHWLLLARGVLRFSHLQHNSHSRRLCVTYAGSWISMNFLIWCLSPFVLDAQGREFNLFLSWCAWRRPFGSIFLQLLIWYLHILFWYGPCLEDWISLLQHCRSSYTVGEPVKIVHHAAKHLLLWTTAPCWYFGWLISSQKRKSGLKLLLKVPSSIFPSKAP